MKKSIRFILGFLEGFLALNAFGGGFYGMAGAESVPVELLEGSPFTTYFLPGLFLFVAVGGTMLLASISVFARWRNARTLSLVAALIALTWIVVQVIIIGYISWMQPAVAVMALLILLLALNYRQASPVKEHL
jgi:hypothetical protein